MPWVCLQFVIVEFPDHGKKCGKYKESIQSRTTPDPGYHIRKDKNIIKHHNQEPEGQFFSAGYHKAAMNRRESMTNTRHK